MKTSFICHVLSPYLLIRESVQPMLRNCLPGGNPNAFFPRNILQKVLYSSKPSRLSADAAVQADGHHFRLARLALSVQDIEGVLEVLLEGGSRTPATRRGLEFHVVVVVTRVRF